MQVLKCNINQKLYEGEFISIIEAQGFKSYLSVGVIQLIIIIYLNILNIFMLCAS